MVGHPLGLLEFKHTATCRLRPAEDARRVADVDRLDHEWTFQRPTTPAERELLKALAIASPEELHTSVHRISEQRARSWPDATPAHDPEGPLA